MADSNNSSLEVNILDENFEKFNYYFDFPQSVEKGYIEILENEINLFFPIMDLVEHSKYSLNQRVLLFINGQLLFSYDWLPIYTNNDLIKIKEMLTKCYYVFSDKIKNQTENIDYTPIFYDEKEMSYSTNSFKLYCFENRFVTSLEINITSPESPPPPDKTCHIKFYLGPNLIFCSQRDLASLSSKDFSYILSLILHKIIK